MVQTMIILHKSEQAQAAVRNCLGSRTLHGILRDREEVGSWISLALEYFVCLSFIHFNYDDYDNHDGYVDYDYYDA